MNNVCCEKSRVIKLITFYLMWMELGGVMTSKQL